MEEREEGAQADNIHYHSQEQTTGDRTAPRVLRKAIGTEPIPDICRLCERPGWRSADIKVCYGCDARRCFDEFTRFDKLDSIAKPVSCAEDKSNIYRIHRSGS